MSMRYEFSATAWEEFQDWMDTDPTVADKIRELLKDISRNPFQGLGKPEALRFDLKGYWSRRISHEHRLVYKVEGKRSETQKCTIVQCKFHYDD